MLCRDFGICSCCYVSTYQAISKSINHSIIIITIVDSRLVCYTRDVYHYCYYSILAMFILTIIIVDSRPAFIVACRRCYAGNYMEAINMDLLFLLFIFFLCCYCCRPCYTDLEFLHTAHAARQRACDLRHMSDFQTTGTGTYEEHTQKHLKSTLRNIFVVSLQSSIYIKYLSRFGVRVLWKLFNKSWEPLV